MDTSADLLGRFQKKWKPTEGRVLVVGSKQYDDKPDRRLMYSEALGLDLESGPGVDIVHDLENPLPKSWGKFAHVDCVSVLEHVQRPWKLAKNIERCLIDGGSILISVPFVWRLHAYPSDYWRMTAEALPVLFPRVEWLSRKYLTHGRLRKLVPGMGGETPWLARAEMVGFGVKR